MTKCAKLKGLCTPVIITWQVSAEPGSFPEGQRVCCRRGQVEVGPPDNSWLEGPDFKPTELDACFVAGGFGVLRLLDVVS